MINDDSYRVLISRCPFPILNPPSTQPTSPSHAPRAPGGGMEWGTAMKYSAVQLAAGFVAGRAGAGQPRLDVGPLALRADLGRKTAFN